MPKKKQTTLTDELSDLSKILSGEMALSKKKVKLDKIKKAAIKEQKAKRRRGIVEGETVMKKEEEVEKIVQNIDLYEWKAPIRYSFQFEPKAFLIIVALSLVFILYLAILGHYGLMASIIALLFFIYAAGTTKPIDVDHKITTRGIDTLDRLYEWFMLDEFVFTKKNDEYMLVVLTKLRMPSKLIMLLDKKEMETVFVLLQDRLLYKDVRNQSKVDVMTFGEYIPLDKI